MIAAIALLSIEAVFACVTLIVVTLPLFELVLRSAAAAITVAILIYLRRNAKLSLSRLRWLELAVLAIPVIEILVLLVYQTERTVAAGQLADVPILRALIGMAISMIITLYGMFIPGAWRRTAIITGIVACLPTATILLHTALNETLQQPAAMRIDIAIPVFLLTAAVAGIASLGAHVVHRIRREMEKARQYGQYQLGEEIGSGAMGVVYKAKHRMLKRPAAIKLIRSKAAANEDAIKKFESEVQISATLSHWNTVQIYDYGRTESGEFFYVMEYLEGQSLQQLLHRKKKLSAAETITVVRQICDGLEEAHSINMVHRDLKPANVYLANVGGQHEVVKILDFGLAVHASKTDGPKTISGTPHYMSPEQVLGDAIDGRSDIYSIGCILFECLSGAPPFLENTIKRILDKQLIALPPMHEIPTDAKSLVPIVEKCLRKDRTERYSDVATLKDAMEAVRPPSTDG